MRKVIILCSGIGRLFRGGEKVALDLAKYLSSTYDVIVYGGKDLTENMVRVTKVLSLDRRNKLLNSFYDLLPNVIKKWIKRFHLDPYGIEKLSFAIMVFLRLLVNKADIIIIFGGFWEIIFCKLLRFFKKTPFITHGGGWFQSNLETIKLKPNAHIIVNIEVFDSIKKIIKDEKIFFIPNGLFISDYENVNVSNKVKSIFAKLERPVYLCVGALESQKRIDLTIKAVGSLQKGSLIVLGEGSMKNELYRLAQDCLGEKRYFQTVTDFDTVKQYYAMCDIFTLASNHEAFGIVYLEALASNKPVVTTNDRTREFVIGKAGLFCNPENIEEYALALHKAASIDYEDLPKKQAKRFDWNIIGSNYITLIEENL